MPWSFPTGKGRITDYVNITSHRNATTGITTVTHVTIKQDVLDTKDWSWLPQICEGNARDNRLIQMAACHLYEMTKGKVVGVGMATHFK